jgi:WD40 repeat protein
MAISPDGNLLAVGDDHRILLWDLARDEEKAALTVGLAQVRIAAFSPDGTVLAVAGAQPEVEVIRVTTGEVVAVLRGHADRVNAVTFSPDGRSILTAGEDRSARLWDAVTGEARFLLGGPRGGHTAAVFAAVFHPDGTRIATGGRDRAIRIWDSATGEELVRLAGHAEYVYALAFSPDGATLVSGSGDHTVRLWDTVPLRQRFRARRELQDLRPEAEELVRRLYEEEGDAIKVMKRIRSDQTRGEPLQRAAWHTLLRRETAASSK